MMSDRIGAIDIPHPHIGERQFEIEIVARFFDDLLNIVREVKTSLGFDDIRELRGDVAIFTEQLQFGVAIVGIEVIVIHRHSFYSFAASGNTEDNQVRR